MTERDDEETRARRRSLMKARALVERYAGVRPSEVDEWLLERRATLRRALDRGDAKLNPNGPDADGRMPAYTFGEDWCPIGDGGVVDSFLRDRRREVLQEIEETIEAWERYDARIAAKRDGAGADGGGAPRSD